MTKIHVIQQMSGSRYDGQAWPAKVGPGNGTMDVPEWEAAELVAAGIAEIPGDPGPPPPPPVGEPEASDVPAPDEPARPPAVNAPKAEWIDHAVAQGHDPADAETMTKAALIEQYGA